jgi:serine/threonine protein kinase
MSTEQAALSNSALGCLPDQASRIIRILERYLTDLERGARPHPEELVAQHPDLAEVLKAYLTKLELLHHAAVGLRGPTPTEGPEPNTLQAERGRLGDFEILREVGRGGMGIVFEAEQISLGRRVALKVLPFAPALDDRQLQRFKNEARAAAHLHHSHIVPVFAVGCDRGVHYYAMQFIEGQSLAALVGDLRRHAGLAATSPPSSGSALSERAGGGGAPAFLSPARFTRLTTPGAAGAETAVSALPTLATLDAARGPAFFRAVAQLGVQAAEALEHAHQLGVVHRDVKPANLLLDHRAHLWVADFGLARCQGEAGLTMTGALIGTLRYMSPEQALARRGVVDHRADIYSLGVTLYELLTLEPACPGRDRQELLQQIAFEEPRPPRRLNPAIPVELETIVLKAMAKEPEGRYATAQGLADDLRRFLENRPILARRPALGDRLRKWARRHKALVASAAGLLVLAVAGLALASVLVWREQARTKEALTQVEAQWRLTRAKEAEAQEQRRRAEANFRKACHGVTQLLLRLEERRWANLPEIHRLRRELGEEGQQFLLGFLNEKSRDPAVRLETGRAYIVLGSVHSMQNAHRRAERAYGKAIALFRQLAAEFPRDPVYRHEMALAHNVLGNLLYEGGEVPRARTAFRRSAACYRQAIRLGGDSRSPNDLAWLLATCPVTEFRDPARAVPLAEQAIRLAPCCGCVWNTLGVAHYRAGNWKAAVTALKKSMELRSGGDSSDWFFLAMAYWRLGDKREAHRWFDRALGEVQKNFVFEPLSRYREEAEALLGRKDQTRARADSGRQDGSVPASRRG